MRLHQQNTKICYLSLSSCFYPTSQNKQHGFTLLEVMITLSILSIMMLAVSALLRGSLDMRGAISEKNTTISRLNIALDMIKQDFEHAYLLSINNKSLMGNNAINYTYFQVQTFANTSEAAFTALTQEIPQPNIPSGELTRLVYKIQDSPRYPNRKALYRGALGVGFEGDPQPKLIVEGIKFLRFELWNGESWIGEWDSKKSEFKERMPYMVRITIRAYLSDPPEASEGGSTIEETDNAALPEQTERRTIVHIPWAKRFPEIKNKPKTLRL